MSVMLVIVLQEVIVCNLNKIISLNRVFHGVAENFLNVPRTSNLVCIKMASLLELEKVKSRSCFPRYLARLGALGNSQIERHLCCL